MGNGHQCKFGDCAIRDLVGGFEKLNIKEDLIVFVESKHDYFILVKREMIFAKRNSVHQPS